MILIPGLKLEAVLAGAVAANQPEVHVDYIEWTNAGLPSPPNTNRVALNSTTDVTILAAPLNAKAREPLRITIYNRDTADVVVTVKTDDGTTERIIVRITLATTETLEWAKGATEWRIVPIT